MKLNKNDYRLLRELQRDGSASYSDLSDKLGITAKTVAKKIERLLSSQVISIRAQPNPYKLGLLASALIAIKTDPSKNEQVCEYLAENFYVNLVQTVFGRLDILTIVYFPNWELLHEFINNELYQIDGVLEVEFYFIKEIFKRYERFFEKELFTNGQAKLKETDWKIIKELAKDGRANPNGLAEKADIHVSTVYRRIEALFKNGVIKISAIPNPSRLTPYSANAYLTLDVDPAQVDNVCKCLYNYPEVHFIMTMNNRSGVIVCTHSKNNEILYQFIQKNISHLKGILKMETFMRAMVKKTYYGWMIENSVQ
ncbi:MAG: Lrp/AsnC family transcriptional regulator [Desulfobacteraceae bacterium]